MNFEESMEWDSLGFVPTGDRPIIWLDIETRKVPAPEGWPFKLRWQPFMIAACGFQKPGIFFCDCVTGTEEELVDWLAANFEGCEVRYSATREFDEMVLRGRFTNARRAHHPIPGSWPNVDGLDVKWVNIRKSQLPAPARRPDCLSKDVPALWEKGSRSIVVEHCVNDVIELFLRDPSISFGKKELANFIK